MRTIFGSLLVAATLVGCASTHTVPLSAAAKGPRAAVSKDEVLVLRGSDPGFPYEEIGLTTKKGTNPTMPEIYEGLRSEAAKQGGHAVVNVRIKTELVTVPIASTSCIPNGGRSTVMHQQTTLAYVASGTLVRRKSR